LRKSRLPGKSQLFVASVRERETNMDEVNCTMAVRWHSHRLFLPLLAGMFIAFLVVACSGTLTLSPTPAQTLSPEHPMSSPATAIPAGDSGPGATGRPVEASVEGQVTYTPDVTFTLRTGIAESKLAFTGVGSTIDRIVNPTLQVGEGDVVQITLINGDGVLHDIALPDFNAASDRVASQGASTNIVFRAGEEGEFFYFCSVPGHRQAGMEGKLIVGQEVEAAPATAQSVVREPTDLPSSPGDRSPQSLRIDLEAVELEGQLDDGATYTYWTFSGKVPGPFLRVRVGDTVELRLKNRETSQMIHSIDLHAVTGPGGGAAVMQAPPGQEKAFTFKALNPGLYVYHCATPMVAHHIANGMYGLILVEPEEGLTPVDQEFYVMQGEIYTQKPFRQTGHHEFSVEKLLAETPEYLLFNGAAGALTQEHPLQANVGERVRIFFGVGGPNLTSSFHVIGEIFDRVYDQASLTSPALTNVQTTLVPPGGATVVEFSLEVPGRYILVDHALSRVERGLAGFLMAEGPENPEVFREGGGTP
jgi:nitrite reductase (NO-forming)